MKLNKVLFIILVLSICMACFTACGTPTYTIQFDLAGGTVANVDLSAGVVVEEGATLDLSNYQPTKENHTFDGWKVGETTYAATDTVVVSQDMTFVAQWIDDIAVALDTAKAEANATLENYVDATAYRPAEQTELATAIANGKTVIDNATDIAGVESALAKAKATIDTIKTDAQLTAEEQALALANAKTTAKATLETYVSANAYRPAQQEELATAIANGQTAIDNATDLAGVEAALASAKATIDTIKTDAVLTTEENNLALANAKEAAIASLGSYVNANNYREAQKIELSTAITNGTAAINNAMDITGVETALANATATIDAIKTDAQLTEEETALALANAKTTAKASLETYVNANDYRPAQQAELATAIANGKTAIDNATDIAGVESALANAKATIDTIKTDAQLTAEEAALALANAKTTAKASLETYKNASDYRPAQQEELATAIANGKTAIDNAADLAGVETALTSAKATIDTIKTDAQLTEEEKAKAPTIWTDVDESKVYTSLSVTINTKIRDYQGKKIAKSNVTVTVNGVETTEGWDDQDLSSYKITLVEGQNTIIIVATDGTYTTTVSYTITCNLEEVSSIVISIEAFSVGMGYIVKPFKLTFDNQTLTAMADYFEIASAEEMKAKMNGAYALEYVIHINGFTSYYTGRIDYGYYLSSISGIDTSNPVITPEFEEKLSEVWMWIDEYTVMEEGTLSEFDFTMYSGWMYGANGVALNVGFDQYIPQNGDVVRVQFTLAYGMDVGLQGGLGMGLDPIYPETNKDRLTALIAEALIKGVDATAEMALASNLEADQETIDAAVVALQTKLQQ